MTKPKMMTQRDKAWAYDDLLDRAGQKGYPTVGEALEAAPIRCESGQ